MGAGPARWSMSSWQGLLCILVSTLPPSPVDTPLSLDTPLERVQSPRQMILLVFLILEWELGWGPPQSSPTGYSRPGRGHTQEGSLVRSPCSFLKVLPRHVPSFGTQLFSLSPSLLGSYLLPCSSGGAHWGRSGSLVKHLSSCYLSAGSSWGCRGRGSKEC